jgi:PAS domain S-box-containing protein
MAGGHTRMEDNFNHSVPPGHLAPFEAGRLVTPLETLGHEESFAQAELYSMIFAACPASLIVWNSQARIIDWNPAAERVFGWTRAEALAKPSPHFLVSEEVWPFIQPLFVQLLEAEKPTDSINDNVTKDGRLIHCEWHNIPMRDLANRATGFVSIVQDVTERHQAEEKLQTEIFERKWAEVELERVLTQSEQIIGSITSILITVDEHNSINTWNAAAAATFGLRTSDMLGTPFDECPIAWDREMIAQAAVQCIALQQPVRLDHVRLLKPDGKERFLGVTINPINCYSDEPKGFLLLAGDITARRILESQLAHAQKLESIGQLAAGIAHEINTPIQYVGDNLRFLQEAFLARQEIMRAYQNAFQQMDPAVQAAIRQAEKDTDAQYFAKEIPDALCQAVEGIERVSHIVRAMKDFSHPGTAYKVATDLNRALDSTITVARNEWKYVADIVMEFDPDLPLVPCLPAELNQVFLNMLVNAAHAIADTLNEGDKGTITVSTHRREQSVEVHIQDTGAGMSEDVKARIFDPFFTTKEVGRGTGQGLAISHSVIVEKHGGTIEVNSTPGQGSTFIIRLPLSVQETLVEEAKEEE